MEERIPLLERAGKGNDDDDDDGDDDYGDDDEDFRPLEETVKEHHDYWEFEKSKNTRSLLQEQEQIKERIAVRLKERAAVRAAERLKRREEFEMLAPKTSTGRETLRPKKFKGEESQLEKKNTNAMKTVEENIPNLDRSKLEELNINFNEFGEITVKGSRANAVTHRLLDDDGNMNESIPQAIKDILGDQISSAGLRDQLEIVKNRTKQYKKAIKKMEESIAVKDDELKKQDDVIKEKEKEIKRLKQLEELIAVKDEIIKSKDDEAAKKVKDVTVIKQMSARDMEEAKKEIEKITNEFKLERDKKINAEKKLESEKKFLVELQKKISSLERERVKMEHNAKEIKESGGNAAQQLSREKEELIKKLVESEQLAQDMADMTQEKIMKANEELNEAKISKAEAFVNIKILSNGIAELEKRNEVEVAGARREINKLTSERNNAQRSLQVLKNAEVEKNADFNREIQRLNEHINDLEQEKAINEERFRVLREQLEQEKAANQERIRVLSEQLERADIGENVRSSSEREREILGERNNELDEQVEREREEIEERNSEIDVQLEGNPDRMSLREKIKSIFKKYGFTVAAIFSSVGVVISIIISSITPGLSKTNRILSNGLKNVEAKLKQLANRSPSNPPGIFRMITEFIAAAAGEVLGFLGKNTWLLIFLVVILYISN